MNDPTARDNSRPAIKPRKDHARARCIRKRRIQEWRGWFSSAMVDMGLTVGAFYKINAEEDQYHS